ncbi:uncharacterized protein LOC132308369 isoform X2 [Cornus florida]|uniref:uncharacterized protein LOC132308369 isoform X2 n=1 Tax=Cornus florida TaxID=4283 RepID=UPI00289EB45E|nr:uncharacterized protein LOC132308369 isoform X2 [Cornus florida]
MSRRGTGSLLQAAAASRNIFSSSDSVFDAFGTGTKAIDVEIDIPRVCDMYRKFLQAQCIDKKGTYKECAMYRRRLAKYSCKVEDAK